MLRPDCTKCIWNESCKQAEIDNKECTDFTNVSSLNGDDVMVNAERMVEEYRDDYRAAFIEYIEKI